MDITLNSLFEFLHVGSAFLVISGIAGRNLAMGQVSRCRTVGEVASMARLAGVFDVWMVRPASFTVLILGLITAWDAGWPIFGFIEGASSDWLLASLVIYASVMALVPTVFVPRGQKFDTALKRSEAEGALTPDLEAAINDRAIYAAHAYEIAAGAAIVFLMVTKPF